MTLQAKPDPQAPSGGGPRDPDFLVIGAMKAGTTTLFEHLRRHPQLFMADPKEPNYFSIDEVYHGKGRDWYRGLFAAARPDQVCGEASPSYTRYPRFPDTVGRIAEATPDVKLVYIMRHPVERFYSNYVFDRSFGFNEPLRDTLTQRPYVLETSRYIHQIRRYLERFPAERLHCVVLDDLREDAAQALGRLAGFLGVGPFETAAPRHANERGEQHAVRQGNKLLQAARSTPVAGAAAKLLPASAKAAGRRLLTETLPQSFLGRWLTRRRLGSVEPLTDAFRAELHELLDPSTRELEEFLGRDLSAWRRDGASSPAAGGAA